MIALFAVAFAASCTGAADEAKAKAKATDGGGAVAARIGDKSITLEELDAAVQRNNPQAYQAYFDARSAALEQLIREELIAKEAAAKGLSEQEMMDEVVAGLPVVDDAAIQTFFNENQARMGGRTLEQVKDQIGAFLVNQNRQEAVNAFMADLKKKSTVEYLLDPPRMEVAVGPDDPSKGPEDAPILIVEFSDFQ